MNENKTSVPFAVLTVWRESSNHFNYSYLCMTDIRGVSKKIKHNIDYSSSNSVSKPILYSEHMTPPLPPKKSQTEELDITIDENNEDKDKQMIYANRF